MVTPATTAALARRPPTQVALAVVRQVPLATPLALALLRSSRSRERAVLWSTLLPALSADLEGKPVCPVDQGEVEPAAHQ